MAQLDAYTCLLPLIFFNITIFVRNGRHQSDDSKGETNQNILLIAQAVYFGLSAALNRHTRAWKHPWGENIAWVAQVMVVLASLAHIALIHLPPAVLAPYLSAASLNALHFVLPTPVFVPTVCFITYRLCGMTNRRRMRRAAAACGSGSRISYLQMSLNPLCLTVNTAALLGTAHALHTLGVRDGGTMYPLFSAAVVIILSGILRAVPGLDRTYSKAAYSGDGAVIGDQILVPVLSWSDNTSVVVISRSPNGRDICVQRLNSILEFTPYRRSRYGAALDMLMAPPPNATDTKAFVEDFMRTHRALSNMFGAACSAHRPSVAFAKLLHERKHLILDDLRVFDGNSSKMRALTLLVVNMSLNVMAERGHAIPRAEYPQLHSVADLIAWAYPGSGAEAKTTHASATETETTALVPSDAGKGGQLTAGELPGTVDLYRGIQGLVLRDASGRAYDMRQLDDMVATLSPGQRHDVMFFLLLQRMAQNNDTRLAQIESLAGGHDVTVHVKRDDVTVKTWSEDVCIVTKLKTDHEKEWQRRKHRSAFESLAKDPKFTDSNQSEGHAFDRVSAEFVPMAWNTFWVLVQHELSWLLMYMASTVVVKWVNTLG